MPLRAMATFPSLTSSSSSSLPLLPSLRRRSLSFPLSVAAAGGASRTFLAKSLLRLRLRASASSSFGDDLSSDSRSSKDGFSKKSALSCLIHEIEPLDVSLIQKDVPGATIDAMKRTISGMLGLLPSGQFQVHVESLWDPLSKLLVSAMVTGYTLRNAEYRLCLEKTLDANDDSLGKELSASPGFDVQEIESSSGAKLSGEDELSPESGENCDDLINQGVEDDMSPEAREFVRQLRSQLSSVRKQLHEVKRKCEALQVQQLVGEEKNDLLDYLRSLQPEKVAELSEPTSPELKEIIHSVVHGLLATLSPKMHSMGPPLSGNNSNGTASCESKDCADIIENTSLQFHPLISLTRDYLARLLFWCMLLGHYVKGLEYRMELTELLLRTKEMESDSPDGKQAA